MLYCSRKKLPEVIHGTSSIFSMYFCCIGMAWLASLYHTDEERGQAMGTAMTGLGLGVLGT